ncbi:MAG: rhombosortase [Planctomycetota bacterium]
MNTVMTYLAQLLRLAPVTLLVSLAALLTHVAPPLESVFELHQSAFADGEWWRLWTGHLTHFDRGHLFWDLGMFIALGILCERNQRGFFPVFLMVSSAVVSLMVRWTHPELAVYRGLSGIDTGLFTWFIANQFCDALRHKQTRPAIAWLAALGGLFAKLVYEWHTGNTLFVDSAQFVPLVEAHLAGAVVGVAPAAIVLFRRSLRASTSGEGVDRSGV